MSLSKTFFEGWRLRRVWWFTATARTKARFSRTFFGSFWLGLSNLLSIAVLAAVYGTVFKVQNFQEYVVHLGLGLVIWNAIASAVGSAPNLFEHNASHIHNTNTNPVFYTLEEWAFQIQTFGQSFLLVALGLSFFEHRIFLNLLSSGFFPLVNLVIFVYWVPLLVCILGARYRDLYQLVPIVLQLVFLLSPILYEKKNLGPLGWTADLNPFYQILNPLRHSMIDGDLLGWQVCIGLVLNILGLIISVSLLNRERHQLPFMI